MHGRMKVRTSEEQAEAKRKEREKEVAAYRQKMTAIFEQRTSGSADKETLKLIEQVLVGNPDISTLWAIRREIITTLLQSCSPEEGTKLCSSELLLMERCLRINPKSYCVWLHRHWTMEHAPSPQWEREKKLCDLFLQYDERNFHCWDYRRYVVKMSGLSSSDEFQFTEEKIAANFSNYSAWHYRSKLLPLIHPSQDSEGVAEDALKNEHELVQNAFYTDPSDQSAWFYHRWLLGKAKRPLCIGCVQFTQGPSTLSVSFNKPFKPSDEEPLVVTVGESTTATVNQSDWPESQWVVTLPHLPPSGKLRIAVKCGTAQTEIWVEPGQQDHCGVWNIDELLRLNPMSAPMTVLTSELKMCQELLEIEPDNKWCLLSCLELMQSVDPLQYHDDIMNTFDKLLIIDGYRSGYYRDIRSRFLISCALRHSLIESNYDLDLSGKSLTRLYYTEHMMSYRRILLSHNSLSSSLPGLAHFKAVQHLCLDSNQLERVPQQIATLTTLRSLSLKHNTISAVEDLHGLKGSCIVELELLGNPVCECSDLRQELKALLPNLTILDGEQI